MFQPLVQRVRRAQQDRSFHFAPLLPEKAIREAFGDAGELEREGTVCSLPVVVGMFLAQVLCTDHSCRPTVGRLIAWVIGQGREQMGLNLFSFKAHLPMEHPGCQALGVRNYVRLHLLAYNLIRDIMLDAALQAKLEPWQLSFKGTVQTFSQFLPTSLHATDIQSCVGAQLNAIATHIVGLRPERSNPASPSDDPKATNS